MPQSETPLEKFQELLRELFQVKDAAELDFGFYRILKLKRAQVEEFIVSRLPAIVEKAFQEYINSDAATLRTRLDRLSAEIVKFAGSRAIDADGVLQDDLRATEAGQEYVQLQSELAAASVTEEQKTRVYNDLCSFFSRYYDDGDFITTRRVRYSGNEVYAIPYGGEEVVLHWATKDQYYVKTTERLKNYRFRVRGHTITFEVVDAVPGVNDCKDRSRRFVLCDTEPVEWDAEKDVLRVRFEYRLQAAKKQSKHGENENLKPQYSLNCDTVKAVLAVITDVTLKALLASPEGNTEKPLLQRHLDRFTRENTSDYFIHKNLRAFLERELDYFIKSECVLLEELVSVENPQLSQALLMRARVVRQIAGYVIDFLVQIEEFQKRLFEKRKFVLSTEYCIVLNLVPEEFWPEILANDAQLAEWRDLFALDDLLKTAKKLRPDTAFLKLHPTLVLDTKHFTDDFKWRLLASFDDLEEALDGLIVKSENFQALSLLAEKYRECVKCIYIDPPFKTGNDFFYKDGYQDSSWLSLLIDRILSGRALLSRAGNMFLHLDWNANFLGRLLLRPVFAQLQEIVWNTNSTKDEEAGLYSYKSFGDKLVRQHDTIFQCSLSGDFEFTKLWKPNRRETELEIGWLDLLSTPRVRNPKRVEDFDFYIERYVDGNLRALPVDRPQREKIYPIGDVWNDIYSFMQSEMRTSENVSFDTQKPENLLRRVIQASTKPGDLVVDYFAGSGTTAAVAHKLNRRYVSTEMGDNFGEFYIHKGVRKLGLLGRLKEVLHGDKTFTAAGANRRSHLSSDLNWNGGGFFAYCALEQYEDALENIEVAAPEAAQTALELYGDDYLLKYMLDLETRGSASLLNLDMFKNPFDYKLQTQGDDRRRVTSVDLVETFNFLLGLHVQKLRQFRDGDRRYRVVLGVKKGKSYVVVWRSVKGIEENREALMRDREFIGQAVVPALLGDDTKPDRLFVNGACFVENAEAIEPEFSRLMFAPLSY